MHRCLPGDVSPRDAQIYGALEALIRTMRQHHRLIEQRVAGLGVHRSQHKMLMMLACREHAPSQKEIADRLGISPAAVARTLKTLVTAGLVEKADGADGRRNEIRILPAGQRKIDETQALFRSLDTGMFEGIGEEELAALSATLERMQQNLDRMEGREQKTGGDDQS